MVNIDQAAILILEIMATALIAIYTAALLYGAIIYERLRDRLDKVERDLADVRDLSYLARAAGIQDAAESGPSGESEPPAT